MAGIFPRDYDGGKPCNPQLPNDPSQAFCHQHKWPIDTPALYYGNGCDVRLRPHVINSLISEIAAVADRAGVGYRASSLQNLETSIRYLIQRGLPHASMLTQQNPWHFTFELSPPPPCETDFMVCCFVPRMAPDTEINQGYLRINMNGLGYRPLYRWDGNETKTGDILNLKPFLAAYFNGAWYIIGRIPPEFRPGGIDLWVRTDGNDATGDGTLNRPDKAFRTITGAFRSVGERFMATPLFTANIKLGNQGLFEGAYLGPFGGGITIMGGGSDGGGWGGGSRWDYRIRQEFYAGENIWMSLAFAGCNSVALFGVCMHMTNGPNSRGILSGARSNVSARQCAWENYYSSDQVWFNEIRDSTFGFDESQPGLSSWFNGFGTTVGGHTLIWRGVHGTLVGPFMTMVSLNFHCAVSYLSMQQLSSCTWGGQGTNAWGGVSGRQYDCNHNSILFHNLYGASGPIPGNIPGTSSYGAQVIPGG